MTPMGFLMKTPAKDLLMGFRSLIRKVIPKPMGSMREIQKNSQTEILMLKDLMKPIPKVTQNSFHSVTHLRSEKAKPIHLPMGLNSDSHSNFLKRIPRVILMRMEKAMVIRMPMVKDFDSQKPIRTHFRSEIQTQKDSMRVILKVTRSAIPKPTDSTMPIRLVTYLGFRMVIPMPILHHHNILQTKDLRSHLFQVLPIRHHLPLKLRLFHNYCLPHKLGFCNN